MIQIKQSLPKKDKIKIDALLEELTDDYNDFYITRDRMRIFIKENKDLLYDCLKAGDKILYDDKMEIKGLVYVNGWSDKAKRHYLKILTENERVADKFLKIINWNLSDLDLFCKIKKTNPIKNILKNNGWRFFGDRGIEILFIRKAKENREIK